MTLRLEAVMRMAFDARLARLGASRLTRAAAVTYLESDGGIEDATYHMALAGVRVTRCPGAPRPTAGLRPAIAFDLVPLDDASQTTIDVVELRPIPLCDASAALLRRRLAWLRGSRDAREACRRLLREEDAVLGWRRIVWCSVTSMRALRVRVRLRPVIFDLGALEHRPLQWSYVSEGAIERWAFT